jgi:hypothetical protein
MKCISRITTLQSTQHYADKRHRFYIEFRCNNPCKDTICDKCILKCTTATIQYSRKYNHGTIYDPLPTKSHLYDSEWYHIGIKKWGLPPSDIIEYAIQCQLRARETEPNNITPITNKYTLMTTPLSKRTYTRKISKESQPIPDIKEPVTLKPPKIKRKTDATRATDATDAKEELKENSKKELKENSKELKEELKEEVVKPVLKPPKIKRKTKADSVPTIPMLPIQEEKSFVLPTFIERSMDEVDTEDLTIEIVHLSVFTVNNTQYYKESIKNKLYKKTEKGVGPYIGRYDSTYEKILTDIPDSDDESE